jgi:hypothetical protein
MHYPHHGGAEHAEIRNLNNINYMKNMMLIEFKVINVTFNSRRLTAAGRISRIFPLLVTLLILDSIALELAPGFCSTNAKA